MIMKTLCITLHFFDEWFHGQSDNGPEWPPSPFRLFQALLAAASRNGQDPNDLLKWLEQLSPPEILSPNAKAARRWVTYVPNNDSDKKLNRQERLAEKVFRPVHISNGGPVHYLWKIKSSETPLAEKVAELAQLLSAVGWGIDLVAGTGQVLSEAGIDQLIEDYDGYYLKPANNAPMFLRCPRQGSFADLVAAYQTFVNRFKGNVYRPARKPIEFSEIAYARVGAIERKFVSFNLLWPDDDSDRWASLDQRKAMQIAAWGRGQACEAAKMGSFPGDSAVYVAGHISSEMKNRGTPSRFSYLPIPSIGHQYADGRVRRFIIAEPYGDNGEYAEWARRTLANALLTDKDGAPRARLQPMAKPDKVIRQYIREARLFQTVTPVVLPGFDDLKYRKAEKLVFKSLQQAGFREDDVEDLYLQKAPFHSGCFSLRSYCLPQYLKGNPGMHVQLRWKTAISGPLAIGAGRHFGLGLFAPKTE
ncbi:MAG: type I-U CRISPR-associated protein Csb2 [Thermodesulfobacteriota bacterium]|nr:type I-U CRISPR-associated protein Csb2 [Thermodesulfobacteriota bacterium]